MNTNRPNADPAGMTRQTSRILRLFGGALVLLTLTACSGNKQNAAAGPASAETPALPVEVLAVERAMLPTSLEAVGQAEGSREVEVRARVSGLLERQFFIEGEPVKAGAPMYVIERAPYEIGLQQAKAALSQRQAQFEQARREVQRLKVLADDSAVPRREYDDAVSSERVAAAAAEAAQAGVREAELNLSYSSVAAPIAGVTGRSIKSQGTLLNAAADSLLTTITQTDPVWVRFSLSTGDMSRLRQSKKATVQLLTKDGQVELSGGRLNFSASTVDQRMGTVQLRAEFANPDLAVLPGQFVRVQVLAAEASAYRVPQVAVTQTEDGKMVWVARNGKAVATPVETGAWIGSDWAIHKGLSDGDQVIVDNLIKLSPDAPVAPSAAAAPAAAAH